MGRPTKKEQALKALAELGINLEDLIEIPEPVEVVKEVEKEVIKEVYVEPEIEIEDNTKVEVKTNLDGVFVMKTKGTNLFKKLNGMGATARIKYSDLDSFYGEHPKAFQNGSIAIKRVVTKGISLENLIEDIGLEDLYFDEDRVSPNDIEKLFTDKVSPSDFTRLVNNTLDFSETILEVGYSMWKKGKFNDNTKMNTLRQIFRNPQLFN